MSSQRFPTELTAAQIKENHHNALMQSPMRVSCALCCWKLKGLAGHVLEMQHAHRKQVHGIDGFKLSRRKFSHLHTFRNPPLTPQDEGEIEVERLRRMRLIGGFEEAA